MSVLRKIASNVLNLYDRNFCSTLKDANEGWGQKILRGGALTLHKLRQMADARRSSEVLTLIERRTVES